jgi:hypothetical protein
VLTVLLAGQLPLPIRWAAGAAAGRLTAEWLSRLPDRGAPERARAAQAGAGVAAQLFAQALRGGVSPARAAAAVGAVLDGDPGPALTAVSKALALGAPPEVAWAALDDGPLAPLGRLVVRSSASGAALAGDADRLAARLTARAAADDLARARAAGVTAVIPVAALFLPAFVALCVVPVALGALHALRG